MSPCPSCGNENPDGAQFCNACGTRLGTAARREERKVVTVVFVDLVGFTARAERLDPEDVRALLAPYHARLRTELERFGGTVEKFIGDAAMALFGAPTAHEDDPERAVRAAISIRDWIEEESTHLKARIAVNTGEALVTVGARPSEGEPMAAGDVVNTAARLQAAAPVNGILVGEQTYRSTADSIDYREVEPVVAKGKAERVRVWEALQARSRYGVDVGLRPLSRLVGRERELELLDTTLARVLEERSPQLVTLVGVPGIGKSRLVGELFDSVERVEQLITWRQGRSLPYGDGVAFWALAEIVKAQAGILETDPELQASEKLRRTVRDLFQDDDDARWAETHLRPLAGLGGEIGVERRDEGSRAWLRFLEALAEQRPLVLVFEDLHWAGDELLTFVDALVDRVTGVPLLALCTARPELLERRPGWGGGKPNTLTLSLPPLTEPETATLIDALLEGPALDAETRKRLLSHVGGNPLYAEQYARILAERGRLEELPDSIQGIIAARLDALSTEEKQVVQAAAVVGKVFWLGALETVACVPRWHAEELLQRLERKQFVQRVRNSSVGGEAEYAFRHVLLRDVAYGQIPRADRGERHRLAAEWIASLGRPEDHAELIADHYLHALEYARAAGVEDHALVERARRAFVAGGDRSLALGVYAAAAGLYSAALDISPAEDPDRTDLLFRCGLAGFWADGSGLQQLMESFERFHAAGEPERAAEVARWLARVHWTRGARDLADAYIDQAMELVRELPSSHAKAEVLVYQGTRFLLDAKYAEAIRLEREALPIIEELGLEALRSRVLNTIGTARAAMGDVDGVADIKEAIRIATELQQFEYLHQAYNNLRSTQWMLGRLDEGTETLELYHEIVERYGTAFERRWLQAEKTLEAFVRGRWDEAARLTDAFLAESEAGSPNYRDPSFRSLRALIRFARDDRSAALADSDEAIELARRVKEPQILGPTLCTRAFLLLADGRRDEAEALAEEILALGQDLISTLVNETIRLIDFAWLARDLGRTQDLIDVLGNAVPGPWVEAMREIAAGDPRRAAAVLETIGFVVGEAYTRFRSAQLLADEGRAKEAEAEMERALAFYRDVRGTRFVEEGEALLRSVRAGRGTPPAR